MTDSQNKVDLKVSFARQNTSFSTEQNWPDFNALAKPVNYVVRRDGLWEVRSSRAGLFIRCREKFNKPLPGFPEETNSEIGLPRYGKIPNELFREILAFFKKICDETKDEVYVQTFWDPEQNKYFNYVPLQRVSGASVQFDRDTELEKRCPLVLETHSHNTMNAFFSGTDNADEKSDRFFGVVGKLNQNSPEWKFSYVCGGERVEVPHDTIFDMEPEVSFPDSWKSRITKYQQTVLSYGSENPWMEAQRQSQDRRTSQLDIESEIELAVGEARKATNSVAGERHFFQPGAQQSPEEDDKSEEVFLELLRGAVMKISIGGSEMSRIQKQRLFDRLVTAMSEEDVADLVGTMLEHGHEDIIESVLPSLPEDAQEVGNDSDPFLNE